MRAGVAQELAAAEVEQEQPHALVLVGLHLGMLSGM